MLTTLSITSLNQGKIAPRYDFEPKSEEELAEFANSQVFTRHRQFSGLFLMAVARLLEPIPRCKLSKLFHA